MILHKASLRSANGQNHDQLRFNRASNYPMACTFFTSVYLQNEFLHSLALVFEFLYLPNEKKEEKEEKEEE